MSLDSVIYITDGSGLDFYLTCIKIEFLCKFVQIVNLK